MNSYIMIYTLYSSYNYLIIFKLCKLMNSE